MKCYLLLRENVENGPYTLEELKAMRLLPTDLVWIEGASQSWRFPYEISELAPFVQPAVQKEKETFEKEQPQTPKRVFVAFPPQLSSLVSSKYLDRYKDEEPELEIRLEQPLEDLEKQLEQHKKTQNFQFKTIRQPSGMGWVAAVLVGVLLSAVMIKKMVDNLDGQQLQVNAAALPQSGLKMSGPEEDKTYRNALATELVPVDTTNAIKKPVKTPKKVNIKKQVNLTASNYRKGVFGGIQGLKLQVDNTSDHVLDKVTIEVKYMKPNGEVIQKENHYLRAVAPKSTKTLDVPPSSRGVKVEYKITKIQSHEARVPMREA